MTNFVKRLTVTHFRHFSTQAWSFHPSVNVILGSNGSGKTSLLEAIYFLSIGRSFRSNRLQSLIQQSADHFTLFAEIVREDQTAKLSLQRSKNGRPIHKKDGQEINSTVEFARWLPVLHLSPDSFQLLSAGSKQRRRLLDWGVFYAEPAFLAMWREFNRVLQQRNAALKLQQPYEMVALWDQQFIALADQIDQLRCNYFERYRDFLCQYGQDFLSQYEIKIRYARGWSHEKALSAVLQENYQQDQRYGATQYGPHRADIQFRIGTALARDILSRGQQKRLVFLLKLAQGACFDQHTGQRCIYLLDDVYSEFDQHNGEQVIQQVQQQAAQSFVTAIDQQRVPACVLSAKHECIVLSAPGG